MKIHDLTTLENLALRRWCCLHGRGWKAELRGAWATASYPGVDTETAECLQRLRNARYFGPRGLIALRTPSAWYHDRQIVQWVHREKDRPRKVSIRQWNYLIALIVEKGGVKFTHWAMLSDLYRVIPDARSRVKALSALNEVDATHWVWDWEKRHPEIVRELEARAEALRDALKS